MTAKNFSQQTTSVPRSELGPAGGLPTAYGLYDPTNEKDSCGVGFVAHIKGEKSRQIIDDADRILRHMVHRGACGCEENTGDGAGMLTAIPHDFFVKVAKADLGIDLPEQGKYGAGVVFLPTDETERAHCKSVVEEIIEEQGQKCLGWRPLPTDRKGANIGPSARDCEPAMEQIFIAAGEGEDQESLERHLYIILKKSSRILRDPSKLKQGLMFYYCSLSSNVIIYKGMLTPHQVTPFFKDLQDPDYKSHLAMVHSRFSTNTFPSWDRAQPCRFMAHNGEINTVRGNANWLTARQGVMESELFGEDLQKLFPIIEPHCSDSGNFDNALELLLHAGRSLPEAIMMMIPE
ncbi:MAG: glutamate synthase subunit alpha, partial [Planctomycetaceae bacterium]|nr:glutamate synthase subunit alpha [Planctomycetaceae bacterium]